MIFKMKPKSLMLGTFFLTVFLALLIQPKEVYATDYVAQVATNVSGSYVNSTSNSSQGGSSTITNGVNRQRTGYLCYLLNADGSQIPGLEAYAFRSPGCSEAELPNSIWYCWDRNEYYTINGWVEGVVARWNLTPWYCVPDSNGKDKVVSNEPDIKAWLKDEVQVTVDGATITTCNAAKFVADYFGNEAANRFVNDEYILVIETLMNFQYSEADASGTSGFVLTPAIQAQIMVDCVEEADEIIPDLTNAALIAICNDLSITPATRQAFIEYVAGQAYQQVIDILEAENGGISTGTGRVYKGDPVIGTVPNLIDYKYNVANTETTVFNSYTNGAACHAEKIATSEAGFVKYTGGTGALSDYHVFNTGVAMMIVHGTPVGQSTYDESKDTTPAKPPKESDGVTKIIKTYRTKDADGTLHHVHNYSESQLSNQICIEDEPEYKVVAWAAKPTQVSGVTGLNWDTKILPASQKGTTPTSVTLNDGLNYLYVLLEKEDTPTGDGPAEANYILSQSTIARHINLKTPDNETVNGVTMKNILDQTFKWNIPSILTEGETTPTCPGHTWYHADSDLTDCGNKTKKGCNMSCGACSPSCTTNHNGKGHLATCDTTKCEISHTHTSSCDTSVCTTDHNGQGCTSHQTGCTWNTDCCGGHTATCTWGQWHDDDLIRGLKRNNLTAKDYEAPIRCYFFTHFFIREIYNTF